MEYWSAVVTIGYYGERDHSIIPKANQEVRTIETYRMDTPAQKFPEVYDDSGFTLLELVISIAILSIIMLGLYQAMGTALSAHDQTAAKGELLARARYAMERMVMFVQETDQISVPSSDRLEVSERVLDTYDNLTQSYEVGGDGYLDADNDRDGVVNEGGPDDPPDPIIFDLDKTDNNNWKLQEQMMDYSTSPPLDDFLAKKVLCEHVTDFQINLLATNLVEIQLTLEDGTTVVSLKTRVQAMYVD